LDSLYGGRIERGAPFAHDRAMPIKFKAYTYGFANRAHIHGFRVAFSRLIDELMQKKAPSGILAISQWIQVSDGDASDYWGFSWAASPDDVSYQRHGFVGMESDQRENIRVADFEGVVDNLGKSDQNIMAVYRVTLPCGGLDPDKWAGRPPPPAPGDIYTGPRRDGLLSTEEISGDYSAPGCSAGDFCRSMTVVPLGADMIEMHSSGCCFLPPLLCASVARAEVKTRNPGTNAFGHPEYPHQDMVMTFSADGTATKGDGVYKKRPDSQKRASGRVDARDLAGNWCGGCWSPVGPLFTFATRKALNEDQYEESGFLCWLGLPCPHCHTRTRSYVNGLPTNGFDDVICYRDSGYATGDGFAKKIG